MLVVLHTMIQDYHLKQYVGELLKLTFRYKSKLTILFLDSMLEKMDARYPEMEKNAGNKHHDHSQLIPHQ